MCVNNANQSAKAEYSLQAFSPAPEQADLNEYLFRMAEIIDAIIPGQGMEAVVTICREFSGTYVYFLQAQNMFRKARNTWIIQQYDKGHKVPEIAR